MVVIINVNMLGNIGVDKYENQYVSMFVNMPVNMSWFIGKPR